MHSLIFKNLHFIVLAPTDERELEDLRRRLREKKNLLVAFSGGVDSVFFAKIVHRMRNIL